MNNIYIISYDQVTHDIIAMEAYIALYTTAGVRYGMILNQGSGRTNGCQVVAQYEAPACIRTEAH